MYNIKHVNYVIRYSPFSIVEDFEFKTFVQMFNPGYTLRVGTQYPIVRYLGYMSQQKMGS